MNDFKNATFCIDSITDGKFEGYTAGENWNGFECPFFEHTVAEEVLKNSTQNGYLWSYDQENDTFLVRSTDDPPEYDAEEFQGQTITVDGRQIKVYGIGAYSWIWGRCD